MSFEAPKELDTEQNDLEKIFKKLEEFVVHTYYQPKENLTISFQKLQYLKYIFLEFFQITIKRFSNAINRKDAFYVIGILISFLAVLGILFIGINASNPTFGINGLKNEDIHETLILIFLILYWLIFWCVLPIAIIGLLIWIFPILWGINKEFSIFRDKELIKKAKLEAINIKNFALSFSQEIERSTLEYVQAYLKYCIDRREEKYKTFLPIVALLLALLLARFYFSSSYSTAKLYTAYETSGLIIDLLRKTENFLGEIAQAIKNPDNLKTAIVLSTAILIVLNFLFDFLNSSEYRSKLFYKRCLFIVEQSLALLDDGQKHYKI